MKNNISFIFKKIGEKKKKVLIRTFMFAIFLFAVNSYAWFIYFDRFDGNIHADVVGWDIGFYDEETQMNKFTLEIDNLQPGMTDYTKSVLIRNSSDITASFTYEIVSFTLFGTLYEVGGSITSETLLADLEDAFPFKIIFSKSKEVLESGGDTANFIIDIVWDFESLDPYYLLNNYFEYDSSFIYYTKVGETYTIDDTVNSGNIASKIDSGLYIESDDADTFWGQKASAYINANPEENCLKLDMNLLVTQIGS